ncbi:MAG TPA: hypothetical protein DD723_02965 [Candidatus Omnitrophica bacterium]|nr:MAG: hypothetical protein A2Z81_01310 [Omnitrophica WOR_2 bacterium GWA2_45_18]HBR14489.1 hypothetical protein [Candidatus Omnitrophota bacterium]
MKKLIIILMILTWIWGNPQLSYATSTQVDALIKKLVEKGILDKKEALELKTEIAADEKILREDGLKQSLPSWLSTVKIKGDFRTRVQYERKKNDTEAQARGRIRYRLGVEGKVNDQVKVGAGLASGSADPRSTNQTFTDSFQHPDIRLDYAYAEYQPSPWAKIVGGKYLRSEYLWTPTDLLWDSDLNPEGGAVNLKHKLSEKAEIFINSGINVLDENGKTDKPDPFMYYFQAGNKWKNERYDATLAAIAYKFGGIEDIKLDHTACTNSGLSGSSSSCSGTLINDYDSIGSSMEIGVLKPFGLSLTRLAVFGDFIHNFDPEGKAGGWAAGVKLGDKKVVGPRQWQLKYQYSYLGKDAFPDIFPDSDRYGGATDTAGHEVVFEYGLMKNVALGIDYYQDHRIMGTKNPNKLIQADINFKF